MRIAVMLALTVMLLGAFGCANSQNNPPAAERFLPPYHPVSKFEDEMYTVAETRAEFWETQRHMYAMDKRQRREDWYSFWLLDGPARTSYLPIRNVRP